MLAGKTKPIKKLSPLTNHKNTKKGTVTGGFNRVNLFKQVEQGFDKLFSYNRRKTESFDYHNTIKSGSISEQFKIQGQVIQPCERKTEFNQENLYSTNLERQSIYNQAFCVDKRTKRERMINILLIIIKAIRKVTLLLALQYLFCHGVLLSH